MDWLALRYIREYAHDRINDIRKNELIPEYAKRRFKKEVLEILKNYKDGIVGKSETITKLEKVVKDGNKRIKIKY